MKPWVVISTITSPIWIPLGLIYSAGVFSYLILNKSKIDNESEILNLELSGKIRRIKWVN